MDTANVSMASTSGNTSVYHDFTSNGEIDITKMRAWSLPSAKRKTCEWGNKQYKRGYTMNTKLSKQGKNGQGHSPKRHSTPDSSSPAKILRKTRTDLRHAHQQQLTELGFDEDLQYVKGLAHYN